MTGLKWMIPALIFALPLAASASCASIKSEISDKIINNGVPADEFSLEIVPNGQVDKAGGLVVGHCENDTQQIVYKRTSVASDNNMPAATGTSHDSSP